MIKTGLGARGRKKNKYSSRDWVKKKKEKKRGGGGRVDGALRKKREVIGDKWG